MNILNVIKIMRQKDHAAVLDIPLRLTIAIVVLSLTLPGVVSTVSWYGYYTAYKDAEYVAKRLATAAKYVYLSGLGTTYAVDMNLNPRYMEYFDIGGPADDQNASTIRYGLKNGNSGVVIIDNPEVWICSRNGETLKIHKYRARLLLKHIEADGKHLVIVWET